MTDEEKKAIEYFKSNLEMTKEMGKRWGFQEEIKNNEIILNLIKKQSKEIEELKEDSCCMTNCVRRDKEKLFLEDKIKAKIEGLDEAIKVNKECIKDNADRITVRLLNDEINKLKRSRNVLQSLLEKE